MRLPFFVRLQWTAESDASLPDTFAPAIIVTNGFRGGGASQSGEDRARRATVETAFTLVSQPFNLRAGSEVSWVREEQGTVRNTLGTFTFLDNAAYVAGTPATFTQRVGAVPLTIDTLQAATFVQAEKMWASGWSVGLGARYQWQTHLGHRGAFAPRLGVSRAFSEGRTTLRGGLGWFYDWLPTNVWEEALRLSRTSTEEEIVIRDPGYPNPLASGTQQAPRLDPPTLVAIADGADMTRWTRASLGLSQPVARRIQAGGRRCAQLDERGLARPGSECAGERRASRSVARPHRPRRLVRSRHRHLAVGGSPLSASGPRLRQCALLVGPAMERR